MRPNLRLALILVLAAAGLAACAERPPRSGPAGEYASSQSSDPQRDRTLMQGETARMSY